ncbi:short stature homeobox protein 2-like, partial [Helianthus annuus]|uniref:short stature homeobox protein 2-like n=1 Tax=Helianthus annuus TaxID=4232 RepID=UPI0016531CB0
MNYRRLSKTSRYIPPTWKPGYQAEADEPLVFQAQEKPKKEKKEAFRLEKGEKKKHAAQKVKKTVEPKEKEIVGESSGQAPTLPPWKENRGGGGGGDGGGGGGGVEVERWRGGGGGCRWRIAMGARVLRFEREKSFEEPGPDLHEEDIKKFFSEMSSKKQTRCRPK